MKHSLKATALLWLLLAAPAAAAPTIEEFAPLPTADSQPQDLVLGADAPAGRSGSPSRALPGASDG